MIIYNYDRLTNEYTFSSEAKLDPLETKKYGKPMYAIPAYATNIEPLPPEGTASIFNGSSWDYIIDHRGELEINLATKEIQEVNYVGEIKDGYMLYDKYVNTQEYRDQELSTAKAKKISENESKRNVEYIPTSFGRLKTSTPLGELLSVMPMYDKVAKANNGLPAGAVRLYNELGDVMLSPAISLEQYNNLVAEIVNYYLKIDKQSTLNTRDINNATTVEEVEAIVIDYSNLTEV